MAATIHALLEIQPGLSSIQPCSMFMVTVNTSLSVQFETLPIRLSHFSLLPRCAFQPRILVKWCSTIVNK